MFASLETKVLVMSTVFKKNLFYKNFSLELSVTMEMFIKTMKIMSAVIWYFSSNKLQLCWDEE